MVRPPAALGRVFDACAAVAEASHGPADLIDGLRSVSHSIKPHNGTLEAVKKLLDACTMVLNCEGASEKKEMEDPLESAIDYVLRQLIESPNLSDETMHTTIDNVLTSPAFNDLPETKTVAEDGAIEDHFKMSPMCGPLTEARPNADQHVRKAVDGGSKGENSDKVANNHVINHHTTVNPPTVPSGSSAHYIRRTQRHEELDPYYDDDDPGYRIREIYETELLIELAEKKTTKELGGTGHFMADDDELAACKPPNQSDGTNATPQPNGKDDDKPPTGDVGPTSQEEKKEDPSGRIIKHAKSRDPFYPIEMDGAIVDCFHLRVVYERDKTGFEESKEFVIRMNDVIAARYQVIEYLGSAAFSRAVQCMDLDTNKHVCMKIIKNDKDFFDQSLDEIKLLNYINVNDDVDKQCVLRLYDYFYHKEHLIIVTELLRDNLYEFSKFNRECESVAYFTVGRLQKIAWQVLTSLEYVHELRLIHCDLKPENILIKSYSRCEVKVIDFGSSCFVNDHLSSYVQSRSYRAPEVLLGLPYDQKIDVWSLGCIIAELWTGYVLFQNDSVPTLLARLLGVLGEVPYSMMTRGRFVPQYFTQDGQLYQEVDSPACPERGRKLHLLIPKKTSLEQRMGTDDKEFLDFLTHALQIDPANRVTAKEAKAHPWFKQKYPDGL